MPSGHVTCPFYLLFRRLRRSYLADGSSDAKVSQLQCPISHDVNVVWFYISVHNAFTMEMGHCGGQLLHQASYLLFG